MDAKAINDQLQLCFDDLSGQMRRAAQHIMDQPDDVALLSMRALAKKADVMPSTMTRLAQRLGFDGFDALRGIYVDGFRQRPSALDERFEDRARDLVQRHDLDGDSALVVDMLGQLSGQLRSLSEPDTIDAIERAAQLIIKRKRLFCIGARSSYPAVYLGNYLLSLIGEESFLVDGAGGIGLDQLRRMDKSDVVLALSIAPYTRNTVEAVGFARERRASIIAITDSRASPIARAADVAIIIPTSSPSFLHTMAPAFVVVECLAAVVAAKRGKVAVKAVEQSEAHLDRFSSYARGQSRRGAK